MNLTSDNVNKIFMKCLFSENEDTTNYIEAKGVKTHVCFNPTRLEENKLNIINMLDDLPNEFKTSGGGGMTFLNACVDKHNNQWGGHSSIDQLICLGLGIGKVQYLMEREFWPHLPGGVPYFVYNDKEK